MPDRDLTSRAPLAELDDVAAVYPGAAVPAIASVTFSAVPGERIAVLGPNGGGKSTLFRVLTGVLEPSFGTLRLGARVALVPQTERSRLDFPVSALDVALMGAVSRLPWWRRPGRGDRRLACSALERVGLGAQVDATFGDLSGGQRQRVLVARALVQDAPLLLLDEPFAGLDAPSAQALTALLDELAGEGRALLMATHDLTQARSWDRVLCLNRVQLAFGPPREALTPEVIERTYGGELVTLESGERAVMPARHHEHGADR